MDTKLDTSVDKFMNRVQLTKITASNINVMRATKIK